MTQTLNLYTMQTLFEQPVEPVDFIVEGLLAPGLYILGGSPKVGKSWLALQLCLAVCDGTSFLGRATHRSEVLYLALEDGPQRLHSRALHLTQTAPSGLYLCGQALPIGQGLEQQLEHTLDEHDYLFQQPNGDPMVPCTFTYRFKMILRENGLPDDLNVHSLRHTNASMLIAQGVDVRTVAGCRGRAVLS